VLLHSKLVHLIAIALFVAGSTNVLAQDDREVPFDTSAIPDAEYVEGLLLQSGILDGLTEGEKAQKLKYLTKYITFSQIISSAKTHQSCSTEIERFCSTTATNMTNSCLLPHLNSLSVCCAANLRNTMLIPGIPEPMEYYGLKLPKGSELYFYDDCRLGEIKVSEQTRIGDLLVAAGNFQVDGSRKVTTAWIIEGQKYKGLPVANNTKHGLDVYANSVLYGTDSYESDIPYGVDFYPSGVPVEVTVASDVSYRGLRLKKGSKVGFHEDGSLAHASASEPYTDQRGRTFVGNLGFYPSGIIRSGHLAEPWTKSKINLPARTSVKFNSAGDFTSISVDYSVGLPGFKHMRGEYDTYGNGQTRRLNLMTMAVSHAIAFAIVT